MSSLKWIFIRAALICSGGFCLFAPASVVQAQETTAAKESAGNVETIVITGSRIQRRDYEANSPILTVDESLLKNSSTAAIETNLTKLPQFHPVQTPTMGGDIQPTATNTPGAATISLRGLGANRNLVLLDGRRATPGNASQVVDINTIPSHGDRARRDDHRRRFGDLRRGRRGRCRQLHHEEEIPGRSSSMPRRAKTERSDGAEYQVGGIMGANLADDKGNVMLAFAINRRQSSTRHRPPVVRRSDEGSHDRGRRILPALFGLRSAVRQLSQRRRRTMQYFSAVPAGSVATPYAATTSTRRRHGFHRILPELRCAARDVSSSRVTSTGTKWKKDADGLLNQNFQDALLGAAAPSRQLLYARQLRDQRLLSVFAQGLFSKVQTQTVQQPSPSVNGWAALHSRTTAARYRRSSPSLLASRPNPTDALAAHVLPGLRESRSTRRRVHLQHAGRLGGQDPGERLDLGSLRLEG